MTTLMDGLACPSSECRSHSTRSQASVMLDATLDMPFNQLQRLLS
jgi:hypothetical protein